MEAIQLGAARCQVASVVDAVCRVVRYVTLGDVVPWDSRSGARGEWTAALRVVDRSLIQQGAKQ